MGMTPRHSAGIGTVICSYGSWGYKVNWKTHSSLRTAKLAGCSVLASAFLLASCTTSGGGGNRADPSRSPAPSPARTATKQSEKELGEQAQAALAAVRSGTPVEAGAERVIDGIHSEPTLSKGKTYRISLACAGKGNARLTFVPADAGTRTTVPCDTSVVQQRITADKPVRIDVDGTGGSTGVIAWQINAV
ncbi:hypothetical protein [Streptomyces sp. AGS-58]|uniref:hypothetical protein n=1 Tax=unclassified Streptomyces TaxID=2593676 RepID=UPI0035A3C011